MPAKSYNLLSTAVPARLSDAYGDGVGVVNAANDLPQRQAIINASAGAFLADSAANAVTGKGIPLAANVPVVLGPYSQGPIKLSELWVSGAATITILTIPY